MVVKLVLDLELVSLCLISATNNFPVHLYHVFTETDITDNKDK